MMTKRILALTLLLSLALPVFADDKSDKKKDEPPAQSIAELQQQLQKILTDTKTPGVAVAIVHRDAPEWIGAVGLADVAKNTPATADTRFRIGSVSKAFASLAILKLVNEGKLSLNDTLHQLAPEVTYDNRWESADPIRVVHLLEHTTGWDDMHLREYAYNAPNISLKDAIDFARPSRVVRWRPGTRFAYCNSGPPVAAYIVEKITGERFEDYVNRNFFQPIGMKTATYFQPTDGALTNLYHSDGHTTYPYWNIIYRPAGSINASANDMANYVRFYLNRGAVNGQPILPAASIDRMEPPESTWAARAGLANGYGLSNYWSPRDGFVWHGHNGGVEGGLAEMSYLPNEGVGFFFSINSGNGDAFERVSKAIRAYTTRNMTRPTVPQPAPVPADAEAWAGWYIQDSPRNEMTHFIDRLPVGKLSFKDGKAVFDALFAKDTVVPVADHQFRELPEEKKDKKADAPSPVANFILLPPNPDGTYLSFQGSTFRRIPTWLAWFQIGSVVFVLLMAATILLYAPFWLLTGLFSRKRRRPAERGMRLWPLLAVLSILGIVGVFIGANEDLIMSLGTITFWSLALCGLTLAFVVFSVLGLAALWPAREGARRAVRIHATLAVLALLMTALYLGYWGIIGFRSLA